MSSLLELAVTLMVAMILFFVGVSGWHPINSYHRGKMTMQQIAAAIHFGRIEAIMRGERVIFCKSSDHRVCGGRWRDGQLLVTASGETLRVLDALPAGDALIWRSSFGRNDALDLLPTGYAGQQGRFYYQSASQIAGSMPILVVNQTGRVRLE